MLVLLLPESGALLWVSVVVVDWDDFSDVSGLAAGAPSAPVAPGAPVAPVAPAGPWVVVSLTVSLHPTPTVLNPPSRNAIAINVPTLLIFFRMLSS